VIATGDSIMTCSTLDFWNELDGDVLRLLAERPEGLSPADIGHKIGVSEDGVRSILTMLAQEGKVRVQGGTANGTQR
jgi:predicted ArsR family transcriptional regulator